MWAWLAVFLDVSFRPSLGAQAGAFWASLTAFGAIGMGGALGCLAGGLLADRFGRTAVTIAALAASGATALAIGWFIGGPLWIVMPLAVFWGATAVADSAQFSAGITELSDPDRIGTMVTVQLCAGFLVTLASVQLVPWLVAWSGWQAAFGALALGSAVGAWAMWRLRREPEAVRLAGGRR